MTVLLKFEADWCSPCKQMIPIIKEIEKEFPKLIIKTVDVDQDSDLAEKYGIMSLPTLVIEKDDVETARFVWTVDKNKIVEAIE